ncbi:hypothetical protein DIPPA_54172, partial [Diplonema papillatum]
MTIVVYDERITADDKQLPALRQSLGELLMHSHKSASIWSSNTFRGALVAAGLSCMVAGETSLGPGPSRPQIGPAVERAFDPGAAEDARIRRLIQQNEAAYTQAENAVNLEICERTRRTPDEYTFGRQKYQTPTTYPFVHEHEAHLHFKQVLANRPEPEPVAMSQLYPTPS